MKVKYDSKEDALYIRLSKGKHARTRKVSSSILIDENADGQVLGVEVIEAHKNMPQFDFEAASLPVQKVLLYESQSQIHLHLDRR